MKGVKGIYIYIAKPLKTKKEIAVKGRRQCHFESISHTTYTRNWSYRLHFFIYCLVYIRPIQFFTKVMSRISMTLDISIYFAFEKGYNYVENKQDIKT